MTKEDAIKYLQQLYPNGGHCWLDEQRIEAISMAIKALQEEPVSEDLEEAANDYAHDLVHDDVFETFIAGAKWQKEQTIDKACEWLKKNKEHSFIGCEDPCLSGYITDEFIEDFKNYMKGE